MKSNTYYFVEGECEKKLIDLIKSNEFNLIKPGLVKIKNVLLNKLTNYDIQNLISPRLIILVYDTDVIKSLDILNYNINLLKKTKANIIHLHSVLCFEDELVRSTDIKNIKDFFKTENIEEFKKKFISCKNLKAKLISLNFNINKMWQTDSKLQSYQSKIDKILF